MMLVFKDSPQYSGWKAGSSIMGDERECSSAAPQFIMPGESSHIFPQKKSGVSSKIKQLIMF